MPVTPVIRSVRRSVPPVREIGLNEWPVAAQRTWEAPRTTAWISASDAGDSTARGSHVWFPAQLVKRCAVCDPADKTTSLPCRKGWAGATPAHPVGMDQKVPLAMSVPPSVRTRTVEPALMVGTA